MSPCHLLSAIRHPQSAKPASCIQNPESCNLQPCIPSMISYFEGIVILVSFLNLYIQVIHAAGPRPLLTAVHHLPYMIHGSGKNGLHPPIRQIFHPSVNAHLFSINMCKMAKPNALYPSFNKYVRLLHKLTSASSFYPRLIVHIPVAV